MRTRYKNKADLDGRGGEELQKKKIAVVELTQHEATELKRTEGVISVEEDVEVSANSEIIVNHGLHKKEKNVVKKYNSNEEWNMQMIHARSSMKKNNDTVKIAVLDSGVDDGNDIDLSYSTSLVPGEEEINPLFMDATGHGNSVAGLIAAKNNNNGITGITPEAEIYSIRILDDENKAPISRVVEGIYLAIEKGVNIINMSFGVSSYSELLKKAVKDADKAGILIVAAAGNTGKEGVQYPAAFPEVVAVGAIDRTGNVVEYSAKGEELELVAPGELVRSTGEFGTEQVVSGTSLAAPHVSAVAAKIWSKDINMPAAFVREVLAQSSNCYGKHTEYGNGLVDLEFAMKNYKKYKRQYKQSLKTTELKPNEKKVLYFEDTGCIKGSWATDDHETMIPSNRSMIKKGARFPDINSKYSRMTVNPWWHGHFKVNYVATFIFQTEIANNIKQSGKVGSITYDTHLTKEIQDKIINSVENIPWNSAAAPNLIAEDRRNFLWGMALHNLADAFSHSTIYKLGGARYYLSHDKNAAHAWDAYGNRYECAKKAINKAMVYYNSRKRAEYDVFLPACNQSDTNYGANSGRFGMINIYDYINQVVGGSNAQLFANVSETYTAGMSTK